MTARPSPVSERQTQIKAGGSLKALVVYEDKRAALRARSLLLRVASRLGIQDRCDIGVWRLDLLDHPQLRQQAAEFAAAADIVLVATRGEDHFVSPTEAWIDLWSRFPGVRSQFLGLLLEPLDHEAPREVELALCFYRFAIDRGMEISLSWHDTTQTVKKGYDRTLSESRPAARNNPKALLAEPGPC